MKKIILCLSFFVLGMASTFAQNLTVTGENASKETKIVFNAVNGKSTEIYQITGQSTSTTIGSSYSTTSAYTSTGRYAGSVRGSSIGSATTNGMSYKFVCTTPNELKLDLGQLQLKTKNNAIFTVSATGGTQYWDIKAGNYGLYGAGITFEVFGGVSLLAGLLLAIIPQVCTDSWGSTRHYDSNKALYFAGVGLSVGGSILAVAGIPMMVAGKSRATLVKIEF